MLSTPCADMMLHLLCDRARALIERKVMPPQYLLRSYLFSFLHVCHFLTAMSSSWLETVLAIHALTPCADMMLYLLCNRTCAPIQKKSHATYNAFFAQSYLLPNPGPNRSPPCSTDNPTAAKLTWSNWKVFQYIKNDWRRASGILL